jgi:hypothetical protein
MGFDDKLCDAFYDIIMAIKWYRYSDMEGESNGKHRFDNTPGNYKKQDLIDLLSAFIMLMYENDKEKANKEAEKIYNKCMTKNYSMEYFKKHYFH